MVGGGGCGGGGVGGDDACDGSPAQGAERERANGTTVKISHFSL